MGVTTNGEINFGIVFEEGYEFPWDVEHDGEYQDWWREINGYKPPEFDPYDEAGNYREGVDPEDPRVDAYHEHGSAWDKDHPFPVELVNYCSAECPMYMLAVPGAGLTAHRGYPCDFDPSQLKVADEQRDALLAFCEKYGIKSEEVEDMTPRWYLTSYWG